MAHMIREVTEFYKLAYNLYVYYSVSKQVL